MKRKVLTGPLTDGEMKCIAFLRLTDQWSVIDQMHHDIDTDQRLQDVYQSKEGDCFVLTAGYIETFVESPALQIIYDRTLMLRHEIRSLCQYGYRTDTLSHFSYDTHRENVSNHIATTAVAAVGIPAISLVLGWALLWMGRGFKSD